MAVTKSQVTMSIAVGIICTIIAATWVMGPAAEPLLSTFRSISTSTTTTVWTWMRSTPSNSSSWDKEAAACEQEKQYRTEIISLDPLVIYIHGFFSRRDIDGIMKVGEGRFNPSVVHKGGQMVQDPYRTSSSAVLQPGEPAVDCVLTRSRKFLGTMLDPDGGDEMGVPQLVRYAEGQHYKLHHDWLRIPQAAFDGSPRTFNRVASFFVVLEANCTGGETWFPFIKPVSELSEEEGTDENTDGTPRRRLWFEPEEGGVAFKPVAGNAIFWVNLFANGTGDTRTVHAGLPLRSGSKTAMNIWPRKYSPNPQ